MMKKIYLITLVFISFGLPYILECQISTNDTFQQRPSEFKFYINGDFRSVFISQDSFFSADSLLYLTGVKRFFNLSNTGRFLLNIENEKTWELYDFAYNTRLKKIYADSFKRINGNVILTYRKGKQGLLRHIFRYSNQYFYKKPVYDSIWQCGKCFWDINTVYFQYIQGRRRGVFDGNGNRLFQKRTDDLRVTCHMALEPIIWVKKKNFYSPFNLLGEQLEGKYDDLLDFDREFNMIIVERSEKFGLYSIDQQKEVIPVIYDIIYDKTKYFICQKNNEEFDLYYQENYYDRQVKSYISYTPLIKLELEHKLVDFIARIELGQGILGRFSNGKMGLYNGAKDGFIIYPKYDSIKFLMPNRYAVKDEEGWSILKTSKNEEPEKKSSTYQYLYGGVKKNKNHELTLLGWGDENEIVRVETDKGKYGWINMNGEIVIPLIYEQATDFELNRVNGKIQFRAKVKLNGRQFEINKNGEEK